MKSNETLKQARKSMEVLSKKIDSSKFQPVYLYGASEFFMLSCTKNTKTTSFNFKYLKHNNYFLERERERDRERLL
jgi:hypothetical protein